ncbi:MAG: hypothetical protein P8P40_06475, partial [Sulfitobacter sp.]|nr:hypothetical protein [Sulfitobacter sp.]
MRMSRYFLPVLKETPREAQIVSTRVNLENSEANLRDQKFLAQQNLTTYLNNFRTALLTIELNKLQ